MTTVLERLTQSSEGMRLFQQECAIQEVTDLVCEIMENENVSRTELARRLGKTKGHITQLLDGRHNLTIRTISDVFLALNRSVHFDESLLTVDCKEPSSAGRWILKLPVKNWAQRMPTQVAFSVSPALSGQDRLIA